MKNLIEKCAVALLSCLFSVPLASALEAPKSYFFINGYYVEPDDARGTEGNGGGADLGFGRQLTRNIYGEIRGFGVGLDRSRQDSEVIKNAGAAFDIHYLIGERNRFSAFVLAGVGVVFNDVTDDAFGEAGLQGTAGLGFISPALTRSNLRLRLEGRSIHEDFLDNINDFRIGLGLEIPLNPVEVVVREVVVEKVVEKVVPAAPAVTSEYYPPRPVDTDGDGILDNFDRCPGTLPRTRVDRGGCALQEQSIRLDGVRFERGSDRLTASSLGVLDDAALALQGQPGMNVIIAGHSDSLGDRGQNQILSEQRAHAVMRYLRSKGVAPQRMRAVGYGESRPLATNETEQGRALNRRVEFEFGKW